MNGLINVYKKRCDTPYQTVKKVRNMLGFDDSVKIGYAGRLDPLASGVLLLMIGDECKNRDVHQNHSKTYTFDLVVGISTDSLDPLGIITEIDQSSLNINESQIIKLLNTFVGSQSQKYPSFSSKTINGISMYKLAKKNKLKENEIPSKLINIHKISLNSMRSEKFQEYTDQIIDDIKRIKGYFRQNEVINSWKILNFNENVKIINITVEVSSGTYIRVLAEEIAKKLDTIGIADNIIRTRVGDYFISNSINPYDKGIK